MFRMDNFFGGFGSNSGLTIQLRCYSMAFFPRADMKRINTMNYGGNVRILQFIIHTCIISLLDFIAKLGVGQFDAFKCCVSASFQNYEPESGIATHHARGSLGVFSRRRQMLSPFMGQNSREDLNSTCKFSDDGTVAID